MSKTDSFFNPDQYATVAERIDLFYARYPEGRINTDLVGRADGEITFRAHIYRSAAETLAVATGALTHMSVRKAERALPRRKLRERAASVIATVAQAIQAASSERCATMLDLAVAAGEGREIWDEPCDRWLELPDDIPSSRYVALRVSGDSMTPVLGPREVILIHLDATPRIDDLIVARLPDQSHVVKRVASIREGKLELASFNPQYEPIFVARDRSSVVGTVIARFTR